MTPIQINEIVSGMSNQELCTELHSLADKFCESVDKQDVDNLLKISNDLEEVATESMLRVFNSKFGYRPYQNKIYEMTEYLFSNNDAYNINRMLSSLRRMRVMELEFTKEKYRQWIGNRVRYGHRAIVNFLTPVYHNTRVTTEELVDA